MDHLDGLVERADHVALRRRERFDAQGDAVGFEVSGDRLNAVDEVGRGFGDGKATGGAPLIRRSEDHHAAGGAFGAQVGTKVDQSPHVIPTVASDAFVGRRDVQAVRPDGKPVQADEFKAFGDDDVADLAATLG